MKIKVLRKRIGEEPELIEIENTQKAIRNEVGGYFRIIGSYVCSGNFVTAMNGEDWDEYNCKVEGRAYYGTILYIGPMVGDFTDADEAAVKRYKAQARYGNLGTKRWIWA